MISLASQDVAGVICQALFGGCYAYEAVIRALGWHFDLSIFGDAVRPLLDAEGGEAGGLQRTRTRPTGIRQTEYRVCMSIHPEGMSSTHRVRASV
jgi:hypothetical protein